MGLPMQQVWGCLYHITAPPTSWYGLLFVFWSRMSFWKFPVHLVEDCSAFGCNFFVFMREVELQSFYSVILIPSQIPLFQESLPFFSCNTYSTLKFLVPWDPTHTTAVIKSHSSDSIGSLTHWAVRELLRGVFTLSSAGLVRALPLLRGVNLCIWGMPTTSLGLWLLMQKGERHAPLWTGTRIFLFPGRDPGSLIPLHPQHTHSVKSHRP